MEIRNQDKPKWSESDYIFPAFGHKTPHLIELKEEFSKILTAKLNIIQCIAIGTEQFSANYKLLLMEVLLLPLNFFLKFA